MPTDRPTFSELWYRVAELRPRLRPTIQTYRQSFRHQLYHVIRDPSNNQFFRLDDAGYHLIALLDGRRTVADAWKIANEQLGDRSPTQGEVIELLGQLYSANLLQAELPADAQGMFDRYRQRVRREVGSYLLNILFVRIPLLDPDPILDAWEPVVRWVFSWIGLAVWALLLATAGYFLVGKGDELFSNAAGILAPDNLLLLYISFAVIKAIHEFGHGFACKTFGRYTGTGGEVHTLGIMFLVFMPVPYVDASSATAFRSKWHKAVVGAGGMYVELAVAAVAAIFWSQTSATGSAFVSTAHALAYNAMFVASVSTLIFNGNPLLRYDGYYILSDLLEIPNLGQRGRDYFYYLVKRYAYGVRRPRNPSRTVGESWWLLFYAVASTIYRVFISVAIFLFVAGQFFIVGILLALGAVLGWVLVPLGRFVKYLMTSPELLRVRTRSLGSTAGALLALLVFIGLIPMPDRDRATGVVEPRRLAVIHMAANGYIESALPSNTAVAPAPDGKSDPILVARNPDLETDRDSFKAEIALTRAQMQAEALRDVAKARILEDRLHFLQEQLNTVQGKIEKLSVQPPFAGAWVSPQIDQLTGSFRKEGDPVGLVASTDDLIIRVVADQSLGPRLDPAFDPDVGVDVRLRSSPDVHFRGQIERILPAGQQQLPSASLGYQAGGPVAVDPKDPKGTKALEPYFEVVVKPLPDSTSLPLFSGQRVVLRFETAPKPLAQQWWRVLRQLFQKRFKV
ncbi:MAG: PqqD family peptide modification chaperone [Phycisphaeraceae bacterium]|nr:PqqD family peptide modification chaperone [Phycisphaeraceae bacterium]